MIRTSKLISILLVSTTLLGSVAAASLNQLSVSAASTNPPAKPSGNGGSAPGSSSASSAKLSGTTTVTSTKKLNKKHITSSKANRSAVYVKNGGALTLTSSTITKTGNTSTADNSNFYGQNAGLLVTKGSKATISNLTEKTAAEGANGIFATGSNAVIHISSSHISTTKNSSRGLDATLKGKIYATNTNISTKGSHSATLATDRGGGTVSLKKGTLRTAGDGSPILYSTGNIKASNINGIASGAEAAVIEGDNNIAVKNSALTASKNNGVMLYQSQSGDAEEGTASFSMTNGSLTSKVKSGAKGTTHRTGALFYVTNTTAKVSLTNVKLKNASNTLIRLAGDRWGTSGKNSGKLTLTASDQTLKGNIVVNSGSSLNLILKKGSSLTGAINAAKTSGTTKVTLGSSAKWNVTKTSHLTALTATKASLKNIKSNGHNVYYDKSNSANSWLNGKTYSLSGGGHLIAE